MQSEAEPDVDSVGDEPTEIPPKAMLRDGERSLQFFTVPCLAMPCHVPSGPQPRGFLDKGSVTVVCACRSPKIWAFQACQAGTSRKRLAQVGPWLFNQRG